LGRKRIKGMIRVRKDAVGRWEYEDEAIWRCCSVQGRYGYDMALVKFLFYNMYVIYFVPFFLTLISYFCHSCPDF